MIKSDEAATEQAAFQSVGGVITKANGNPKVKDYIDALRKMSTTYASWNWSPIPTTNGILFKFPSQGGLNILAKRDVIQCNNGHFVVSRWREDKEGMVHNFPTKLAVLAFNLPPFLRSDQDLARMVANFAHLIATTQILEEGGPMKLILGCRCRSDVPRELPVIVGGREYKITLTIREELGEGRKEEEQGTSTAVEKGESDRSMAEGRFCEDLGTRKKQGGLHTVNLDDEVERNDASRLFVADDDTGTTGGRVAKLGQTNSKKSKDDENLSSLGG